MKAVQLGDVSTFVRGITFKPSDVVDDGVGVMRTKNVQEYLELDDIMRVPASMVKRDDQYLREGDTLVSSANSWYAVGRACWVPRTSERLAIGGFVTALRPTSADVDPRYLYRWFTSSRTQATLRSFSNKTTNISNLNLKLASAMPISLPSLGEQRRIAAILDQADAIRSKRRQVLAHLNSLTQSIFREMFNFGTAPWRTERFRDVVPVIGNGTSPNCEARPAGENEWGVLKLGAVTYGDFRAAENKAFLGELGAMASNEVHVGDVLMTRKNTRDLVGAVAVVDEVRPRLLLPDLIFRLDIDRTQLDSRYFQTLMMTPSKRSQVRNLSSGSAASMPNISKARLANLPIEVPPLPLQKDFAARSEAINDSQKALARVLAADDALFASLQARAFRGEL
ncbi:restriction endonuclease subunit S [Luteipulveratus halotolerans]|uniref:restriction endonuclease subunit S n=1 Tax=Luteipulveratus halotolerans TaxID=1631356 RepID=UPI0008FBDEA4|nr:restriction endonuclease subunit S [Luteipulveratus halotolerans]